MWLGEKEERMVLIQGRKAEVMLRGEALGLGWRRGSRGD